MMKPAPPPSERRPQESAFQAAATWHGPLSLKSGNRPWERALPWTASALILVVIGIATTIGIGWQQALLAWIPATILLTAGSWFSESRHRRYRAMDQVLATINEDPRGIALSEAGGRMLFANTAFQRLLGPDLASEDLVSELASLVVGAEGVGELRRLAASAAAGVDGDTTLPLGFSASGHGIYRIQVAGMRDLPGRLRWTIEDVTASHEMETIRDEERRLVDDFIDNLPVGFFSADSEGRFLYVNRPLAKKLGISLGDIQSRNIGLGDFILAEQDPDEQLDTTADPDSDHGVVVLRDAEGDPFKAFLVQSERLTGRGDFIYSRSLLLWEFFDPSVLGGTGRNWEWLFRALFAESPVGIVQLDLDGVVVNSNKAFLKLLGLHREGVMGRPLAERVEKADRDGLARGLDQVLAGRTAAAMLDIAMPAAGGRTVTTAVYANRIDNMDGQPVGTALHFIDTTERKQLEAQFTQSQKVQAVGQLAGGIAHDFNNLLTAMIGFCDLLLGRVGPGDPSFSDIMQIKQNANRAANLVRQLLAFSRRQTLQPKIINITHALGDLTNLINRLIGEKIQLRLEHGRDLKPIKVDPGQLDQVIVNLAVNARDAMTSGGVLSIRTRLVTLDQPRAGVPESVPPGHYLEVSVADTGTGISREDLGRIFEPFFSTKAVGSGTGLGLSTVYGIIRQTGGYITVQSEPGAGTIFSLFLPVTEEQKPALPRDSARGNAKRGADLTGNATVLLVEDEDAVRLFASRALSNKGYRVLEADNGENALQVMRDAKTKIDLVISDIVMPGMDGHALVRELRAKRPNLKVILISGYSEDAIPEEVGTDKTLHFLNKPFSLDTLAGKVKEVLDA